MATQVQWRGGSTAEHATFTGAAREVTVDTQKQTLVLHDGSTAGGRPLLGEDGSNAALALGSAGTPSLKFTGDPNTGIYSPGADQVAISTNGTGRLFVDASGNVGVGVASPVTTLHLQKPTGGLAGIQVSTSTHGSTLTDGLFVGIDNSLGYLYNYENLPLVFGTNATERMRLDSTGRLGLGTSSPAQALHVASSTTYQGILVNGNVAPNIAFDTATLTAIKWKIGISGNNSSSFSISAGAANDDKLIVDSSGRVGIGTTTPGYLLDVRRASAGDVVAFTGSTDGGRPLKFVSADNGVFLGAQWTRDIGSGSGIHAWAINGTERARIDSSGRLLVGTSSSGGRVGATVQIAASGAGYLFEQRYAESNASGADLFLTKSRGSIASPAIVNSGDNISIIRFSGYDGASYLETATIASAVDGTPGTNDMPGRLVFSTTADGAASPTERMRITSAGVLQIADAGNISVGTTTGTKIGTATTQKLGFYNATPVVQPTAVADATDAASVITQLNALLTRMRNLGLIAT